MEIFFGAPQIIGKTNLNANTESKDLIFFCLYFGINLELDKNEPLQRT